MRLVNLRVNSPKEESYRDMLPGLGPGRPFFPSAHVDDESLCFGCPFSRPFPFHAPLPPAHCAAAAFFFFLEELGMDRAASCAAAAPPAISDTSPVDAADMAGITPAHRSLHSPWCQSTSLNSLAAIFARHDIFTFSRALISTSKHTYSTYLRLKYLFTSYRKVPALMSLPTSFGLALLGLLMRHLPLRQLFRRNVVSWY